METYKTLQNKDVTFPLTDKAEQRQFKISLNLAIEKQTSEELLRINTFGTVIYKKS